MWVSEPNDFMKNIINLTIDLNEEQVNSLIKDGSCIYNKDKVFIMIERTPVFEDDTLK
jgi:hypothetical protein